MFAVARCWARSCAASTSGLLKLPSLLVSVSAKSLFAFASTVARVIGGAGVAAAAWTAPSSGAATAEAAPGVAEFTAAAAMKSKGFDTLKISR